MKKILLCIGLITILFLTGFSAVSAIEDKSGNISEIGQIFTKEGTIYGPYKVPAIIGQIKLYENASYTAKYHIGNLYIYRDLKLRGYVWGPGPGPDPGYDDIPMKIQTINIFKPPVEHIGEAILTMKLYIGPAVGENVGQVRIFMYHIPQGFGVTLESIETPPEP